MKGQSWTIIATEFSFVTGKNLTASVPFYLVIQEGFASYNLFD